jgi:hypothetical protein
MHSVITIGAFLAILLTPCIIASRARHAESEE